MSIIFRLLGDPVRLQIVHLLSKSELCVCDLSELLHAGQSTISNHLRILRDNRLVRTRREGKLIFYSLNAPHLTAVINETAAQVSEEKEAVL